MLLGEPDKRPIASEVSAHLLLLAGKAIYDKTLTLFNELSTTQDWPLKIPKQKLIIWARTTGIANISGSGQQSSLLVKSRNGTDFERRLSVLHNIREELSLQLVVQNSRPSPTSSSVCNCPHQVHIDKLRNIESPSTVNKMDGDLKDSPPLSG